jgi:recombinational DNA repair protein (RecF pathway)
MRFEVVLLRELGYSPTLEACAGCTRPLDGRGLAFSAAGGGAYCSACQGTQRDRRPLSPEAWQAIRILGEPGDAWRVVIEPAVRAEVRQVLNNYVTYLLGRRPRLLPYLGS